MAKSISRKIDEKISRYGLVPIIATGLATGIGISPFIGTAFTLATFIPYSFYVETDAKLSKEELAYYGLNPESRIAVHEKETGIYRVPRNVLYGFPLMP